MKLIAKAKYFFLRLKGDYFRYIAEFSNGKAFVLPIVNTTRLGLSLIFQFFIIKLGGKLDFMGK